MKRWLSLLGVLLASPIASAQLTPEEAMKKFTVADGLQIELFAAEPDVINPTSIDVDHVGRVWVCEAVNYRRKNFNRPILRKEGDRITVLEDTNSDGKADKTHVFYQGEEIYAPLGICVAPSPTLKGGASLKVYVCQSPDILVFEDKDGDLKADGPPKKFLTGFNGYDHDHGVHGINIGPDGKLYFTVGDAGVRGLQAADGKGPKWTSNDKDVQKGTVWRCDMDGKNLELIAHNFRNNYECCVNSFGEIWLSDNDDDGNQQTRICHVMPGGNYGYGPRGPGQSHWHEEQPGIVHKVLRTGFGSPTGICFYEGNLLPKKYHGQLMHTDAGPRELRCFHIKPKGAGYEAEKEVLVTSSDNWFRLSDVCVAPDGSLIISDWYDPGVGGHGMGDWTRGRIYRVTPKGHKGYKVPEVKAETKEAIVDAIANPCLAVRHLGADWFRAAPLLEQREISGLVYKEKFDPLTFTRLNVYDDRVDPLIRARLFWHGHREIHPSFSGRTAYMLETDIRGKAQIVRMVPNDVLYLANRLEGLLSNAHPSVRREFLVSFVARTDPNYPSVSNNFYTLAKRYDGQDQFYRAALNIACGTDPVRRNAILADFDKHFPEWNDKVADLVWELRPTSVLPRMVKLLRDEKLTNAQKARIVDILASSEDLSTGQTMFTLLGKDSPVEVRDRALENLRLFLPTKWKTLAGGKEAREQIDTLLSQDDTKIVGLKLIAAAGTPEAVAKARELALNDKDAGVKKEAIQTLGKLPSMPAVDALASLAGDKDLGVEAVKSLGGQMSTAQKLPPHSVKALDVLKGLISAKETAEATKRAAIESLAGSRVGTDWLLESHEKKQLPTELVADAGKLLRNSPFQGQRNKALILFPAPGKLDPKKLPPPSELAKRSGNAERGKQIFAASLKGETQCAKCHTVRGVGGNIGPDLSMIGKKASLENLFESILVPNKAIADQYLQWQIENAAGQKTLGLIVEEDATGVTIRDANGKDTKIAKADVENRSKSPVSIMPEDLVKTLSEDDLVDLVAYLFTLKTASLTPESWRIVGPFENGSGDKGLDTAYGPESGKIDLAASYKGKTGEVKWGVVKQNGTGYVDLAAHHGKAASTDSMSYLYQRIESPVDQEATILIGNDDGCRIWLNGEKVFENREHLAATPERNKATVKLKKGINDVLIKIVNGNDPHGLYFSVTSEQELKAVR